MPRESWVMLVGLLVMGLAGFGSRNIFESDAAICSGIAVLISLREKKIPAFLAILGLALIGAVYPSVYRLQGFWVLLLSINVATIPLAFFPVTSWFLEYLSVPPAILQTAPLVVTLCAQCLNLLKLRQLLAISVIILCIVTGCGLIAPQPRYCVKETSTFASGYKIGSALQKIFPKCFGGNVAIRSNLHGTKESPNSPGIVIAEHDTPAEKRAGRIKDGNYIQPTPWSENEFLGNQYWRYAVREDGFLVSNLGGELTPVGRVMLAIPSFNPFRPKILASKSGEIIYCSDSDYWINRLCGYQQNLLGVILSDNEKTLPPVIANIAFAVIAAISLWWPWISLAGIPVLLLLTGLVPNRQGDVRLIGPISNPHDPARAWAIIRRLQDDGINAVYGNNSTKALVVQEGLSSKVRGEKLVVGEPRARILIGSHQVSVLDEPLGHVDAIPDARMLIIDGVPSGVKAVVDGVTVVGTGSPALTPIQLWSILRE